MSYLATPVRLLLAGACVSAACGLTEVFKPSRTGDVGLAFTGDTVVSVGDQVPFGVVVTVGGNAIAGPRFAYAVSDTAFMRLAADSDGLIGVRVGRATLTAQWLGSIFTDTLPTLVQEIRVTGAPGP